MHLGILKTDAVRPEWVGRFGEYPDMFERVFREIDADLQFSVWDVEAGEWPLGPDEVDGFIITGSKSSFCDDKDWIRQLESFVRQCHARRKKIVGICFGHQLIAQALGGHVGKAGNGWGVGIHEYELIDDTLPSSVRLLASHQDQVQSPPPGARVIARNAHCPIAGLRLGEHVLTFQGHPEFIPEYAREIMEFRRAMIGDARVAEGLASLASKEHEGVRVAAWILEFFAR